ncbi:hypothetical protein, partial [Sphingomonas adhaesiva]|uniref:hypothetical protein n=1 Tax=Sphingomonas adhaesiva TaxID=28212 RepID=UPI001C3F9EDE
MRAQIDCAGHVLRAGRGRDREYPDREHSNQATHSMFSLEFPSGHQRFGGSIVPVAGAIMDT